MSRIRQKFWTGSETPVTQRDVIAQVGALCLRQKKQRCEVLLVKSTGGRWILPKGWPMQGLTDAQAAKVEAWEEAGVDKGKVSAVPVGGFVTRKILAEGEKAACHVTVYRIDVKHTVKRYPEAGKRKRKWVPLSKAAKKADGAGLRRFLRSLVPPQTPKQ